MWEAEYWSLKHSHILIPGTDDCVTLYGKRDFTDVVKLRMSGIIMRVLIRVSEKRRPHDDGRGEEKVLCWG